MPATMLANGERAAGAPPHEDAAPLDREIPLGGLEEPRGGPRRACRTAPAEAATALPARTVLRLAKVPTPNGMPSVSPPMTVMSSRSAPRASAAIWAKTVSWPCPCEHAPVATTTLPEASSRTVAPS